MGGVSVEFYMTTQDAADLWKISTRRISILCKEGRISGAYKDGKQWMIPVYAEKPADKRKNDAIAGIASK